MKVSKVKTTIEEEKVIAFLRHHFNNEISKFTFIKGGESSQAFSFDAAEESFVIRVNSEIWAFEKDRYSFIHFNSPNIPIPEVLQIGSFDDKYSYAISRQAKGKMLIDLSDMEYKEIFLKVVASLDAIHGIDISKTSGFGKWETDGSTETKTWKEYVLAVNKYVYSKNNEPSLFDTSFLEKDIWEKTYEKMSSLLQYCPEKRYLVHGDYGSDNVIADHGQITGILDWAGAKYGDFLYDVAWLNFWDPARNPLEFFKTYYHAKGDVEHFSERVLCYQLRIALSSLSFYAFSDQKEKYEIAKIKLLAIIKG